MANVKLIIIVLLMISNITCFVLNNDLEQQILNLKQEVSALKNESEILMTEYIKLKARLDAKEHEKGTVCHVFVTNFIKYFTATGH